MDVAGLIAWLKQRAFKAVEQALNAQRLLCFKREGGSEFEDGVFDGQADVAVGFGQAADGFWFVYFSFEHYQCDWDAAAGALDGVYGGLAVDAAGAH
jgi:hypothetical protein